MATHQTQAAAKGIKLQVWLVCQIEVPMGTTNWHKKQVQGSGVLSPEANSREPVSWSSEEISVSRGNFLWKMQREEGGERREEGGGRREEGGVELKKLMSNQYPLPSFCIECFIMY